MRHVRGPCERRRPPGIPQGEEGDLLHGKGETVVISPEELDQEALKKAVEATGYQGLSVSNEPYEKKGFFSFGK